LSKQALLVTVDVEEWYHSNWFDVNLFTANPESFFEEELKNVLDLFREIGLRATFFVLAGLAVRAPGVIERIMMDGHELACHGLYHDSQNFQSKAGQSVQVKAAKQLLERITHEKVLGFRSPNFGGIDSVTINTLEASGYLYDSSVVPCLRIPGWYGYPSAPLYPFRPSKIDCSKPELDRNFWEVPVAVFPDFRLPGGGGWFLRNIGAEWTWCVVNALFKKGYPATIYVHPWEFSERKSMQGVPFHVFRRTGGYVKKAVRALVRDFGATALTVTEYLESK
jgi:hypothetical protein